MEFNLNMDDKEKPLYTFPYKGKPRFITEGLLRDESTTSSDFEIMIKNSELSQFHQAPFPSHKLVQSPTTPTTPSPLTSPSSFCSPEMPSTPVEKALQKVLNQCQYLISYLCYEALFSRSTTTKDSFRILMFDQYHGNKNHDNLIPHAYYMSKGFGKYKHAFDQDSNYDDQYLRLTDELTQENDYKFIVNEIQIEGQTNVITLAMLKRKTLNSNQAFSPRSITTYAETALRNCKNAIALGQQFFDSNGLLPSGWSRQNYLEKVLDLMYDKITNEPKARKALDGDIRADLMSKKRPTGWVFNGFMAFVLFGPLAKDDSLKSNLMTGSKYKIVSSLALNPSHIHDPFSYFTSGR